MRLLLLLLQLEALLVSQTKLGARRSPLICSSCFPLAVQHELPLRSLVRSLVGLLVLASFWPPVCLCFVFFVDASTASTGCAAPFRHFNHLLRQSSESSSSSLHLPPSLRRSTLGRIIITERAQRNPHKLRSPKSTMHCSNSDSGRLKKFG